jgi:hypothetical protein
MLDAEQQSAPQVAVRNTPLVAADKHILLVVFQQRILREGVDNKCQEGMVQYTQLAEESIRIEQGDLELLRFWEGVHMHTFQVVVDR